MSVLQIFMFGGFRILLGDKVLPPFPTRKTRSLFAYLVAYRQRHHSRHVLAGMFWGDMPQDRAQRNLSTTLWRLRRILPSRYLLADENALAFNTDEPYWLDTEQFERELDQAKGDEGAVVAHLQTAIRLYRGDFLQGLYDDWLLVETERLRLSYQQALQRLFGYYKSHEQLDQALEIGQQLLALDPLREDIHLGMMEIYHQLGQRSAALAQYQRCRDILQKELAVEPLPETKALYQTLLATAARGGRSVLVPPAPAQTAILPRTPFDDFGQAPWVGREQELRLITQRLERLQDGSGGMILVGGEAGVGKTRLAERATHLAQTAGLTTLWGVCPDLQEPPPYQGLSEILQKGLAELDIEAAATPPSWLRELAFLLPDLRQRFYRYRVSTPDPDDALSRSRLLAAIWHLLGSIAAQSPCLLVLDDIHWADTATLEALRYLLPHLRNVPILFLLTFRPEELPGRPTVAQTLLALEANRLSTRLNLPPLTATETEQLLQRALGLSSPHPILAQLVYSETEGNPFFIGEILKALVEEKLLYLDPEHGWRTPWDQDATGSSSNQAPPSLPLPSGIRRLVEHRLARLSQPAQRILAQLAVLGREIDYDVLFHVCDVGEEELLAATDALLHRHLLVETKEGVRFSHDKIRQTVYKNLSRPRRRQLHRRAGETLASIAPDRVEELAHHFHQAHDHARTLDYALAAGERARRLYANQAALTYYGWAIQAAQHLDTEQARRAMIEAHEQRGRIHRQLAEMTAAVKEYGAMKVAAEAAGDHIAKARAVRLAGWVQGNLQGKWDLGLEQAHHARRLAQEARDPREEAAALRDIGAYHNLRGEHPQALTHLRAALTNFRKLQDQRGEAGTLQYLAVTYHFLNRYDAATNAYERALLLWQSLGDRMAEGKVLANLGYLLISDGRLAAAADALAQAEITLHQIEATAMEAWVRIGQAAVARYQGRYRDCLHILELLSSESDELIDSDYLWALIALHSGMARWHLGELGPALLNLEEALARAEASDTPSLVVGVL
ncbi:MAG: AAA family ATPase, partial [Chloroflexi bacterium]|nr:AAA family ATPase [Chloroflexota bacterium]